MLVILIVPTVLPLDNVQPVAQDTIIMMVLVHNHAQLQHTVPRIFAYLVTQLVLSVLVKLSTPAVHVSQDIIFKEQLVETHALTDNTNRERTVSIVMQLVRNAQELNNVLNV
jgi:hypothetical protein